MIKGVTDNIEKFYLVLGALTEDTVDLVKRIVEAPATPQSYGQLRAALIASHSFTPYQKVDMIVNMEPLGSRKPSELMAAMKKYRPDNDARFFVYHFLQHLPREIRLLLARDDHTDLRALTEKADDLMSHHVRQEMIAAATADSGDEAVTAAAAPKSGKSKKKRSGKGGGKGGGKNQQPAQKQLDICSYHARFGDKAYRCEEPCAWSEN